MRNVQKHWFPRAIPVARTKANFRETVTSSSGKPERRRRFSFAPIAVYGIPGAGHVDQTKEDASAFENFLG
jgi:hypothetical protein